MIEELNEFSKSLRAAGVFYSQRGMFFDAVGAVGYSLPEFVLILSQTIVPTLGTIIVVWLNGRSGRKISVKIRDVEVEAPTEEIGSVLEKITQFLQDNLSNTDDGPKSITIVDRSFELSSATAPYEGEAMLKAKRRAIAVL
jgi:hypothetical protein